VSPEPLVSIIVPFHNSAAKCAPLLDSLLQLRADDPAELILVDDGSVDSTPARLAAFAGESPVTTRLIRRSNGGPGAARNSGLDAANGRYVWFVDSDDLINPAAVAFAQTLDLSAVDVLAWDYEDPETHCPIPPGLHDARDGPAPSTVAQTFVAKWFATDFLRANRLRFPEFCAYETAFEIVLPLYVRRYLKSDFNAYRVILDHESVTRDRKRSDARFYDRIENACLAMSYFCEVRLDPKVRRELDETFVNFCLWYNIRLSRLPGPAWLRAVRVMRRFRSEAARFGIRLDPFAAYRGRKRSVRILRALWAASRFLPSQDGYFRRLRMAAWGREIAWQRPASPPRWSRSPD
jgi:glycosyltransferase involved in cell wall biosynthesis